MAQEAAVMQDKALIEDFVLAYLHDQAPEIADSLDFASQHHIDHASMVGVCTSLFGYELVLMAAQSTQYWVVTEEALKYVQKGTPEFQVLRHVGAEGIHFDQLRQLCSESMGGADVAALGISQAMRKKLIAKAKDGQVTRTVPEDAVDSIVNALQAVQAGQGDAVEAALIKEMKDRKMIKQETRKSYKLSKGAKFARVREKPETDLTTELLRGNEWASKTFKDYNFQTLGRPSTHGALHPLLKVRTQFRSMLLEMGFEEMPTNKFVESSFWNFDALFQPQQHPARDAHDTFFLSSATETLSLPADYVERVKTTHETGGYGSIGWRYDWSLTEAKKNLLRTHTTAVSSRMLYALAQQKEFTPKKYFSIDRVFRNETVDATHLAEFHQIEGLIADRNLSLCDLIGVITRFFQRLGISQVKFKPAYNPYTEPSMEIFGFSPELKRWIEIGNSGIFRPEMLLPMGLPEDVRVIAWGLSLERPTMIKYGIGNIRDLFGHKVDLNMVQHNPVAFFA